MIYWAAYWCEKEGPKHILYRWNDSPKSSANVPALFYTRRECREWIKKEYGYIKHRKDLRGPPLDWRMPRPLKVRVKFERVG